MKDAVSPPIVELPPLARGIRNVKPSGNRNLGITPARAGNTLGDTRRRACRRNYPRSRGEYCSCQQVSQKIMELPPLARGILFNPFRVSVLRGITPARAGNTIWIGFARCRSRNYPRSRGEYGKVCGVRVESAELPPLARGILYEGYINEFPFGITPARAGNTLSHRQF